MKAKAKLSLTNLIRYHINELGKMVMNGFTPAQIKTAMNIDATEAALTDSIKKAGMAEYLTKETKKTTAKQKLYKQRQDLIVAIEEFASRKAKIKRKTTKAITLVSQAKWKKIQDKISKYYVSLGAFCEHKKISEDEFELVFAMQPTKNWQKVLVAMESEDMITGRDVKRYINATTGAKP